MWVAIAIPAALLLVLVVIYNGLVWKKNRVEKAFSSIDVYLKMRYDLIPNLVAAVKGYMEHEQEVIEKVTELRGRVAGGGLSTDEAVGVNNEIGKLLHGMMVVVENYPELKASENVQSLQRNLTEIEDRISAARRAYNAAVTDFNNAVEMFPSNVVAGMFGYRARRFFEAADSDRENPNASLR